MGADVGVRAGIVDNSNAEVGEPAIGVATEFRVLNLTAAVEQRFHVVTARRHPHDRSSETLRQRGDDNVFGHQPGFAAKASADLWRDDVDLVFGNAQRAGKLVVQCVRHLRRRVQLDATAIVHLGGCAIGLDGDDGDTLVDVSAAYDVLGPRRVRTIAAHGPDCLVVTMCGEDRYGISGERRLHVDDGRQRIDIGPDQLSGVLADGSSFGQHHRNGLADETHGAVSEWRPLEVIVDGCETMMRRDPEIRSGDYCDNARQRCRFCDADRVDRAVSDVGTCEHRVQRVGETEIVDVLRRAREQRRVLGACDACAEN